MWKKALLVFLGTALMAEGVWWGLNNQKTITMLNPLSRLTEKKEIKKKSVVMGFLPTWMVGKTIKYTNEIDEMVFLGIDVGSSGNLVWDVQAKKINNQDYLDLKANIKKNGGKNILGIKIFDDEDIDTFLASDSAKLNLITELKNIKTVAGFDGINVDFEYMSDAQRLVADDFIVFLQQLKASGLGKISVDVMANTIIKGDSEKLRTLIEATDNTVVMAYDFHRPASDYAGSVAPIGSIPGERNISEVGQKLIESNLPKEKIIMAYPLYGYMWQTADAKINSATIGGGWMVSWNEAKGKTVDSTWGEADGTVNWDELSMTPWASFSKIEQETKTVSKKVRGKWRKVKENYMATNYYQVFFENEKSLGAKLDLAKNLQVGGVGFWALGYEGEDGEVWKLVREKLGK